MQNDSSTAMVVLDGPLVLSRAAAIQTQLLQALDAGPSVKLDVTAATDVDVSFVQILVAANRSAQAGSKSFVVSSSALLNQAVERCGLSLAALPPFIGADA